MFFIINRDAHETNDFQYNIDLYYMHAFNLVYARALFWCVQAIYTQILKPLEIKRKKSCLLFILCTFTAH